MSTGTMTSSTGLIVRHARRLAMGIAVAAPIAATAIAAPADFGLPAGARMVTDEELGEMRGRFIALETVNFFGVQFTSTWTAGAGSPDSVTLTATLQFEADFTNPDPNDPNLPDTQILAYAAHSDDGDPSLNIGDVTLPALGGLTSLNGAAQSNEISGSDNDVLNVLNIRIGGEFDADTLDDIGDQIGESTTLTFDDQSKIQFKIAQDGNGLGVVLYGPTTGPVGGNSDGFSTQSINSDISNQLVQSVQLIGNANAIQNTLDVVVGVDQSTQLMVENALSSMKGWGF
jgi:hypothetical protein